MTIELLTTRMQELNSVIGLDATLKLVKKFGGIKIWIPKKPKSGHQYELLIGEEAFKKLTAYYGDTYLDVDKCVKVLQAHRNQQILADSEDLSDSQLALKYNLTMRHITRIRHAYRDGEKVDERQLDIFSNIF